MKMVVETSRASKEKFFVAIDDSMAPTIRKGDDFMVDTQIDQICTEGVFLFCHPATPTYPLIRRVQRRRDGAVILKADNHVWEPDRVRSLEEAGIRVLGRVTKVLRNL